MSSSSLKRTNPSNSFSDQPRKITKTSHQDNRNGVNDAGQRSYTGDLHITSKGILPDRGGLFTSPSPVSTQTRSSEMELASGSSTPRSIGNRPAPVATMSALRQHEHEREPAPRPLSSLLGEFASRLLATASLQAQHDIAQVQLSRSVDEMARTQKFFTSYPALLEQKNNFHGEATRAIEKLDLQLREHVKARDSLTQELALAIELKGSDTTGQVQKLAGELRESKAQIAKRGVEIEALNKEVKLLKDEASASKQNDKDVKKRIRDVEWAIDKEQDNEIWTAIDKQNVLQQAIQKHKETSEDDRRWLTKQVSDLRQDYIIVSKEVKGISDLRKDYVTLSKEFNELKSKTASPLTGADIAYLKGKVTTQEAVLTKLKSDIYGGGGGPENGEKERSGAPELQISTGKSLAAAVTDLRDAVDAIGHSVDALKTNLSTNFDNATARMKELNDKQLKDAIEVESLRTQQEEYQGYVTETTDILREDLNTVTARLQDLKNEMEARITELQDQHTVDRPAPSWQIKSNGFSSSQLATNGQIHNGPIRPLQPRADANVSALVELGARVDALVAAIQNLEDRYNNISTDQLYRRIVHALHERYPNAFESLEEMKRLHARLDEFQTRLVALETECRVTSASAYEARASVVKVHEKVEKLEVDYGRGSARLGEITAQLDQVKKLEVAYEKDSARLTELTAQLEHIKIREDASTVQNTGARNQIDELGRSVTKLKDEHLQLSEEVTEFKSKLLGVEAEQTSIKADQTGFKEEQTSIKSEQTSMKKEQSNVKEELKDTRNLFASTMAVPLGKIDYLKERLRALEDASQTSSHSS